MKKLKFYVLVLCSAMSVVSCDAIGRNKSALNELGKELGFDAGFGMNSYADDVASYLAQEIARRMGK